MTDIDRQRIERYRPRLERLLEELLALRDASAQGRAAVPLDQQSVGRLSRMDAMQAQQMALAADRQRQAQISRIRRALSQMDHGEFGYCLECGNEIPDGRLNADPAAHLCVSCAKAASG
ncbi:MAG: TraR/DksA C4-type zinc finger protein [Xanthobacteraceae bacterium]